MADFLNKFRRTSAPAAGQESQPNPRMPDSHAPSSAAPAFAPHRVLYAEDEPMLRDLFSLVLRQAGHRVETAADGRSALDLVRASFGRFDVVLTDHQMPGLNGLGLVRELRRLAFPGRIAIFASRLADADHAAYRDLGVDVILPKPLFPSTLIEVIGALPPVSGGADCTQAAG